MFNVDVKCPFKPVHKTSQIKRANTCVRNERRDEMPSLPDKTVLQNRLEDRARRERGFTLSGQETKYGPQRRGGK